ncbi:hypothetical protein PCASD_12182 [Puccinia coronata f. sp. avenae]|uniref:Uncharacterized protein n=1 Tax=Puccinia coronata f. sp. avenae TaxID=200324 RepID=A0A2N5UIT1_9BASI|nr:hypothetical protein PCASD_12182 [Puccinia coronata f. sp. avenae]
MNALIFSIGLSHLIDKPSVWGAPMESASSLAQHGICDSEHPSIPGTYDSYLAGVTPGIQLITVTYAQPCVVKWYGRVHRQEARPVQLSAQAQEFLPNNKKPHYSSPVISPKIKDKSEESNQASQNTQPSDQCVDHSARNEPPTHNNSARNEPPNHTMSNPSEHQIPDLKSVPKPSSDTHKTSELPSTDQVPSIESPAVSTLQDPNLSDQLHPGLRPSYSGLPESNIRAEQNDSPEIGKGAWQNGPPRLPNTETYREAASIATHVSPGKSSNRRKNRKSQASPSPQIETKQQNPSKGEQRNKNSEEGSPSTSEIGWEEVSKKKAAKSQKNQTSIIKKNGNDQAGLSRTSKVLEDKYFEQNRQDVPIESDNTFQDMNQAHNQLQSGKGLDTKTDPLDESNGKMERLDEYHGEMFETIEPIHNLHSQGSKKKKKKNVSDEKKIIENWSSIETLLEHFRKNDIHQNEGSSGQTLKSHPKRKSNSTNQKDNASSAQEDTAEDFAIPSYERNMPQ